MDDMRFGRRDDAPAGRSQEGTATRAPADPPTERPTSNGSATRSAEVPSTNGSAARRTESPPPVPRAQGSPAPAAADPPARLAAPDEAPAHSPRPRRSPLLGATPTAVPPAPTARRSPLLGATPTAVPTDKQADRHAPPQPSPRSAVQTIPLPAAPTEDPEPVSGEREAEATREELWPDRTTVPRQRESPEELPASAEPEVDVPTPERPPAQYLEPPEVDAPTERPPARYLEPREEVTRPERPPARYTEAREEEARPKAKSPKEGRTLKARAVNLNWRSVGALVVALAVAFWIGRGLFGGGGPTTSSPSDQSSQKVAVPKEKTKVKKVVIDGTAIRAAGALITLNPALAQPGAAVTVSGSGFDPGSAVDLVLSTANNSTGTSLGSAKTDRTGNLAAQVTIPDDVQGGKVIITAKQRYSDRIATAEAVTAAGMGFAKLNKTTGKPGDTLAVNARGFAPNEKINVYWGRASGKPTSTLQASESGTVSQAPIRVGVGQVGEATLVLVGAKSGTTATVPFYMLGLYPTAQATPYALKAAEQLNISAAGFAPEERILIYVNTSSGRPAMTAKADTQGNIGGLGFKVPFGLKGSQSLVMVGEESRASVSSGFQVLPYTPSVQTSTYGGSPGTSLSFFAKGFAPNEVVLVYLGRTKYSPGELVSAFRVNDRGEAGAAGDFQITGSDNGTLTFSLVGRQSRGQATASVKVTPANGPVDLPPREKYTLPRSLR